MATATTMTGAQFDALSPAESRWWELFDGELIEVASPTPKHQRIVSRLNTSFENFFDEHEIGAPLLAVDFALGPNWRLQPDIAVLLMERWKTIDINRIPVQGIPDIAIEVISPSERTTESTRKVWTYLRAGVQEVWQIFPETQEVAIYAADQPVRIVTAEELLTTPLLPGWSISVKEFIKS